MFFALGVGEVARSLSRRRLDLPVWIAFGVAAIVPLVMFSPLILQARTYARTFWNPLHRSQVLLFYSELLRPAALPLGAALLVAVAYAMFRSAQPDQAPRRTPPVHEFAVAFGFAVLPPVAFVIATLVTNAFVGRYLMPTVIGFSILVAFALYCLPRGRALIGTALLLVLGGWFVVGQQEALGAARAVARDRFAEIQLLQDAAPLDLPIIASEPHIFMALAYYGPPAVTSRLVSLGDPDASLRHLGHNSVDRGMVDLIGPWFGLPVRDYRSYLESHPRFLVYGNLGWLNWVTDQLRADNRRLELKGRRGGTYLFLVTRPE